MTGVFDRLQQRAHVVKTIRRFFDERGYTEVQTPRLVSSPGQEPYLDPLWTTIHNIYGSSRDMGLITSPEYSLKKLLGEGMDKVYDLGPCFRDHEPWDKTHDVEFLLLEWYRKNIVLQELMDETEELIRFVLQAEYTKETFRRMTVKEAWKRYLNEDLDALIDSLDAMRDCALRHHQTIGEQDSWDDLFYKIFLTYIEPHLGWNADHTVYQPTFLYQYPASQAALAKRDTQDPCYALRVELYIGDLELCNGFEELADPVEQRKRFIEEQGMRKTMEKRIAPIDERLLEKLPQMGQCCGNALGIDRIVMLKQEQKVLSNIMPIPLIER